METAQPQSISPQSLHLRQLSRSGCRFHTCHAVSNFQRAGCEKGKGVPSPNTKKGAVLQGNLAPSENVYKLFTNGVPDPDGYYTTLLFTTNIKYVNIVI